MIKIQEINEFPTLFWLLDLYIPEYQSKMGGFPLDGYLLASSKQVWNLISTSGDEADSSVQSCLIGPAVMYGSLSIDGQKVPVRQQVAGVIFDSTELRPDKPVPLLDIISPDVIDPTTKPDAEQVTKEIRILELKKGQHLPAGEVLAKVREGNQLPSTLLGSLTKKTFTIKTTSGVNNAKVCLGGLHRDKYNLFVKAIRSGKLRVPEGRPMLDLCQKKMISFDKEYLSQYVIVELNPVLDPDIDSFKQFVEVYHKTLEYMLSMEENYFWG